MVGPFQAAAASQPLLILHGANGSAETMQPLVEAMLPYCRIEAITMLGHGGRPVPPRFTVRAFAEDVVAQLDRLHLARAFVCGYSFGGYVALYLARFFPQRVAGVCTLAAKYVFDPGTVRHWTYLANPVRLQGNGRGAILAETHYPEDWIAITTRNAELFVELGIRPALGDDDLRAIAAPVLLVASDRDRLVSVAETMTLGNLLPKTCTIIFGGPAHPIEAVPRAELAPSIADWMAQVSAGKVPELSREG